ncbi:MAG TPA: alpha,alpha-trehalase TreA [Rhizomicrobium sp.]|nr:alpha,alpha-trehalase TreA [Rhizomicrobium sp.]
MSFAPIPFPVPRRPVGRLRRAITTVAWLIFLLPALAASSPMPPPSIAYGALYGAVEMAGLFPDQKNFADAIADEPAAGIVSDYARAKDRPGFSLRTFVARHFTLPKLRASNPPRTHQPVAAYIHEMWRVLRRPPDVAEPNSSLLPLPHPYIVPGGRFTEIYYWDSYFTLQGLMQDHQYDLARDMVANIAALIARHGHMPNGNRTYYLSRSQPPFFAAMVDLIAVHDGDQVYRRYLPQLQAEYDYWMEGAAPLAPGATHRHLVRLKDGTLLNRYWDDRDAPRDESWREDVMTARRSPRPAPDVYRDLRAGAESGWDYSSRWLADGRTLASIHTTDFVPVDLNSLLQHLEAVLAKAYGLTGDTASAHLYEAKAARRADAIRRLMWAPRQGLFVDYLWRTGRQSPVLSAATVYPLYFGIATPVQAHAIADGLRRAFLRPGGLATTLVNTGQQWDAPNGWAPLQYLAIEGLKRYGEDDLARTIARRWMQNVLRSYATDDVLLEKYDVETTGTRKAGGGEYALQAGFGWTNGVLEKLMAEYPQDAHTP